MNMKPGDVVRKVVGPLQRVLRTIQQTIPAALVAIGSVEAAMPSDEWSPTTILVVSGALTAGLTVVISAAQNAWEGRGGVDTPYMGKPVAPPTRIVPDA